MYHLNDNPSLHFQLNRLVNMDMGDLDKVCAMGFYRMAEFYMDWKVPESLRCWRKARELFFAYFEDFFAGGHPIVEKFGVPYETYTLPLFKMNPDGASIGKQMFLLKNAKSITVREFFLFFRKYLQCDYVRNKSRLQVLHGLQGIYFERCRYIAASRELTLRDAGTSL